MLLGRNGKQSTYSSTSNMFASQQEFNKREAQGPPLHKKLRKMHGLMSALERQPIFEDHVNKEYMHD
jgi:hypothetical protein